MNAHDIIVSVRPREEILKALRDCEKQDKALEAYAKEVAERRAVLRPYMEALRYALGENPSDSGEQERVFAPKVDPASHNGRPIADRCHEILKTHGKPMSIRELVGALSLPNEPKSYNSVFSAINWHIKNGKGVFEKDRGVVRLLEWSND